MNISQVPSGLIEYFCAHELFRRLGYFSADIHPLIGQDPRYNGNQLFAIVHSEPEFLLRICNCWCSEDELDSQYKAWSAWWNEEAQTKDVESAWENSRVRMQIDDIILAMLDKGIKIPMLDQKERS